MKLIPILFCLITIVYANVALTVEITPSKSFCFSEDLRKCTHLL